MTVYPAVGADLVKDSAITLPADMCPGYKDQDRVCISLNGPIEGIALRNLYRKVLEVPDGIEIDLDLSKADCQGKVGQYAGIICAIISKVPNHDVTITGISKSASAAIDACQLDTLFIDHMNKKAFSQYMAHFTDEI